MLVSVAATTELRAQNSSVGRNSLDQLPIPNATVQATKLIPLQVEGLAPASTAAGKLDQTVQPSRFDIEGVDSILFADVARLFAPMVQQSITVGSLVTVAAEATALYRAQGYPLSFVYIPVQNFHDGVVRIVAVEGFIASVRIEGDAGPVELKLRDIAQRLTHERPLRLETFERISQLLSQVPGITLTTQASIPSTTDGATALVLKVRRQPYNLSIGTILQKPTPRTLFNGVVNDPIVPGSQLSATALIGDFNQENLFLFGYTQLVGNDGLVLNSTYSEYRGYPNEQYRQGDLIERYNVNRRVLLSASYPLLLNARTNLTLTGGVYAANSTDNYQVPQNRVTLTDETNVRALFTQLAWTDTTDTRLRATSMMVAHGLPVAGASASQTSNTPGLAQQNMAKLDFTRIVFDASQRDRFWENWGTAITFGGQYSPNSLATSERIAFGGARFGRGYGQGEAIGDSGWGAGIELNRRFLIDGGAWLQQVELYALYEAAQVMTNIGEPLPRNLRSAAIGLRWSDLKHYSLDLAIAKPIGDATTANPDLSPRVILLLTYQFDP